MATQKGIVKLNGTIGDITFYRSKDGYMAREKGGVDPSRIANDPAFLRTRENGREFSNITGAGKILRTALRPLMMNCADSKVVSRLVKIMAGIKNMDSTSDRGERNVATALDTPNAKLVFNGFDFNTDGKLSTVLFAPYRVDMHSGAITFDTLDPRMGVKFPEEATHMGLTSAFARVDFLSGEGDCSLSPTEIIAASAVPAAVTVTPAATPATASTHSSIDLFLLKIEFYQRINGRNYSLKNGSHNVLNILKTA